MLKIAIDCRPFEYPMCGIRRYAENLITCLPRYDSRNEYFLVSTGEISEGIQLGGNFKKVIIASDSNMLWEQVRLPRFLSENNIDILHNLSNYGLPYLKHGRFVLTVHDILPRIFPDYWAGKKTLEKVIYNFSQSLSINRSDKIISDSKYTGSDLIKYFSVKKEKISVIYPGVEARFKADAMKPELKEKLKISELKYVFHVCGQGFNKNTEMVLAVFERLKGRGFPHKLVIAGHKKWISSGTLDKAFKNENIIIAGLVSDEEMSSLYANSALFIFPSTYEGFGLPVLEAMACGTPVLTSRVSSLPEIAADAAVYVDPYSEEDMLEKISDVLSDDKLRQELIRKGRLRAREFSWEETVKSIIGTYEEIGHRN